MYYHHKILHCSQLQPCGILQREESAKTRGSAVSLFVLEMEVFLGMLQSTIARSSAFSFYPKCETLKLTRLCFADDLMLFSSANIHSLTIIQDTLEAFKRISDLSANPTKSENFLSAVPAHLKHQILDFLQFKEGKLPVKYLGVPLILGR